MNGCQKCGSDRLKAAPIPIVSALLAPFVNRRRYACANCGWRWWSRPLRHRSGHATVGAFSSRLPKRAGVFSLLVLLTIVLSGLAAMRECRPRGPGPVSVESP